MHDSSSGRPTLEHGNRDWDGRVAMVAMCIRDGELKGKSVSISSIYDESDALEFSSHWPSAAIGRSKKA